MVIYLIYFRGIISNDMAVARYTFAVNRRYKRDGEQEADFGWVYYIKSVNAQKIVMGLEVKIN